MTPDEKVSAVIAIEMFKVVFLQFTAVIFVAPISFFLRANALWYILRRVLISTVFSFLRNL